MHTGARASAPHRETALIGILEHRMLLGVYFCVFLSHHLRNGTLFRAFSHSPRKFSDSSPEFHEKKEAPHRRGCTSLTHGEDYRDIKPGGKSAEFAPREDVPAPGSNCASGDVAGMRGHSVPGGFSTRPVRPGVQGSLAWKLVHRPTVRFLSISASIAYALERSW